MISVKSLSLTILRWLVALVFLAVGGTKLLGAGDMIALFDHFQLPIWFMYFTGAVEVSGAVGLLFWNKTLGLIAAIGLSVTMAVASVFHLIYDPLPQVMPAMILALFCAVLAASQRAHLNSSEEAEA